MLYGTVSPEKLEEMKQYLKEQKVSFVFECVDMEHDPHIIEYPESRLYLLDIVENQMEFCRYEYESMCRIAGRFGLCPKERAYEIAGWPEFFNWYGEVLEEDYEYKGRKIEGFVIEDSAGFMTKLKLRYYQFWKFMRGVAQETLRRGYIRRTSALTTPTANAFYAWLKTQREQGAAERLPKDICTLRRMFYDRK